MGLVKFVLFCCCFFCCANAFAQQKKYSLLTKLVDTPANALVTIQAQFESQSACVTYLNNLPTQLRAQGYIGMGIDTVQYKPDTAIMYLYLGKQYKWKQLYTNITYASVLNQLGFNSKNITYPAILQLQQNILNYYQTKGYPFASTTLDSIELVNNTITGKLGINPGILYRIDSIRQYGTASISNTFMQKYLGIRNGSIYNKTTLDAIPKKLAELPYLQQQYNYNLTMLGSTAVVNVYLQPRKSNIINVLLGVIPVPNPNGLAVPTNAKVFLSGDANILLNNMLGTGETLGLIYQQLSINSRRINLQYKQPYMFGSSYGADVLFEIYKRDSSFLNIDAQLGSTYNLSNNATGRLFIQYGKTNTFPDTATVRTTRKLGNTVDIQLLNLGFTYKLNNTNYSRNPRRGNELATNLTFGTKNILVNSAIGAIKSTTFNYNTLYDSIKRSTYQFKLLVQGAHYKSLTKTTVLKLNIQAALLLSQNYFRNELYQIGGFKLLRGFDEESQFCNQYAVGTAEYRVLIGGDSYLYAFADVGYTTNQLTVTPVNHTYLGTGLGINLGVKNGVLNISFAVGTRNDIPLSTRQAKLHFGYVSMF